MTLDEYLASRFGPVFDVLNDAGGVPEELMECLKRGAVWGLAEKASGVVGDRDFAAVALSFNIWGHETSRQASVFRQFIADRKMFDDFTPDDLFPHLSHLIESEALT